MSDTYQAVYDAVRSRISNGDIGSVVRDVAWQQFDISFAWSVVQDTLCGAAGEMQRPSAIYRPTISLDGNCYCALYGEDLMSGCAGFGTTMAEAMADFDKNWISQKAPAPAIDRERLARCLAEQRDILLRRDASVDRSGEADETSTKIEGSAEGESAVTPKAADAQTSCEGPSS